MQTAPQGPANSQPRPSVTALFLQIKAQHPRWPDWRAEMLAKRLWTKAETGGAA